MTTKSDTQVIWKLQTAIKQQTSDIYRFKKNNNLFTYNKTKQMSSCWVNKVTLKPKFMVKNQNKVEVVVDQPDGEKHQQK